MLHFFPTSKWLHSSTIPTEGFLYYLGRRLKIGYFFSLEQLQRSSNLCKLCNPTIKYPRLQKLHHIDSNIHILSLDVSDDVEFCVRPISLVNISLVCYLFEHILMITLEERNCTLKYGICPISDTKFLLWISCQSVG